MGWTFSDGYPETWPNAGIEVRRRPRSGIGVRKCPMHSRLFRYGHGCNPARRWRSPNNGPDGAGWSVIRKTTSVEATCNLEL